MQEKQINIRYRMYESYNDLPDDIVQLIHASKESARKAYAPYSGFRVGTALMLGDRTVIKGNNQENAAFPSGMCAERVAVNYANANYPDKKITMITISVFRNNKMVDKPVPPCGSCRQVILESEQKQHAPIKIILAGAEKVLVFDSICDLLPLCFARETLNNGKTIQA